MTLFCCKKLGRQRVWVRHILNDVNFHGADQLLIADKEVRRHEEFTIRVPVSELDQYVDAYTWKALAAEEIQGCFTFGRGDYLVKGIVEEDIGAPTELMQDHQVYEIVRITENLRGTAYSRHIRLVVQ